MEHLTQFQIEQMCAMQLSVDETKKLEEHLDSCTLCTDRYEQYFQQSVRVGLSDPKKYMVNGELFKCVVCKNEELDYKSVMLNTRFMTFLNFEWLNSNAHCYRCACCKYIHWFTYPLEELGDEPVVLDK